MSDTKSSEDIEMTFGYLKTGTITAMVKNFNDNIPIKMTAGQFKEELSQESQRMITAFEEMIGEDEDDSSAYREEWEYRPIEGKNELRSELRQKLQSLREEMK